MTASESITFVAIEASTCWGMIYYVALSINSTQPRTWVNTFFSNTSLITSTFWIDRTLGPATWRCANVCWQARTWRNAINISTLRILATRTWIARVPVFLLSNILGWSYNAQVCFWEVKPWGYLIKFKVLRGILLHIVNGFPVKPLLHEQIGLWLFTLHTAFVAQVPEVHGLIHFWFTHALSNEHSELTTHSGRQPGGLPT